MMQSTKTAARAIFSTDPTISEAAIVAALDILDGKMPTETKSGLDRLLTAKEVAALLNRTTKTIRELAKAGKIRAVYTGMGERAAGYSAASVRALLAGRSAEAAA
ncbi:MAG: helix-turn-helix domain-containing protein [Kiritimatiellae bacterium]|nr:helix-turn-helix domain-containing protein [Kiritimatiellia bacterium]